MNIIFLSPNKGALCTIGLCKPVHWLVLFALLLLVLVSTTLLGYLLGNQSGGSDVDLDQWKQGMQQQRSQLEQFRIESAASIEVLSSRLGLMQAHVNRIDALGQKLVKMAEVDNGEFDFSQIPAVGGPALDEQSAFGLADLNREIDQLVANLEHRENQLVVLEDVLLNRNLLKEVRPSGRPITSGWLSSYYGMRTHPISGKKELHKGVDFAGKQGGQVISVAKGVVTFAGTRYGYGKVIDINHGDGYTTRYGHNSELLVSVGDTVEKGFQIARIGSSGRSTGPHVHFEVLLNGKQVNPMKFINAAN